MDALSYTNRRGDRYYLHARRTATGKLRYVAAKTVGDGALDSMPNGYEFTESINGVVSVRRIDRRGPQVSEQEVEIVRAEMARHDHLRHHRAEGVRDAIVVFEPFSGPALVTESWAREVGIARIAPSLDRLAARTRYAPVLKLVPDGVDRFAVHRMTYRGEGGWSWPLASGPLPQLARRFVGTIGTSAFFELM